jgi:hypothetical protein
MRGINPRRWIAGGVAAGALMWLVEGLSGMSYQRTMEAALADHGLSMQINAETFLISVAASLIAGLALIFLYAAARPRFGPGPRTAVLVAVVLWAGGYFLSMLGYHLLGLFPDRMLFLWGATGLVEMILGALLGGWIYREGGPGAAGAAPRR